jgi:hypothetical protein
MVLLSFGPISPLIVFPGILYFGFAQVVYFQMLSNVYEPRFEIGGGLWIQVRGWLINICLFSQTFLLFVFLAQQYWLGVSSCFLLAMLTLKCSVHLREMDRDFHHLPLTVAVLLDDTQRDDNTDVLRMNICTSTTIKKRYKQSVLDVKSFEHPEPACNAPSPRWYSTDPIHGGFGSHKFMMYFFKWFARMPSPASSAPERESIEKVPASIPTPEEGSL